MILHRLYHWWQSLRYHVILDPADNSVTLSRALFRHLRRHAQGSDTARVFVFWLPGARMFGFRATPHFHQPTQLCDIQYNDRYHCIGFETLCPSVGRILYNYHLPADRPVKLSVSIHRDALCKIFYQIERPRHQSAI